MKNEKVVVTKEVAEAIELTLESKNVPVIVAKIAEGRSIPNQRYKPLEGLSLETLMRALVNGYEVERSSEEKVREYYDRCRTNREEAIDGGLYLNAQHLDGQVIGASITLNLLGIKIEGVNA